MGYDLHITRAEHWTDSDSKPIRASEWERLVAGDHDLEQTGKAEVETPDGVLRYENPGLVLWHRHPTHEKVWFDLRHGRVVVKNPDEPTIEKMLAVAQKLGAHVVGDDGETYAPGVPPTPAKVSLLSRVSGWLQRLRPTATPTIPMPPFGVGTRVRDAMGNPGVVVDIDPRAMHGYGSITVRFDDGRQLTFAMFAHGLEPI